MTEFITQGPFEVHISSVDGDDEWQFLGWASELELKYDAEYDDTIISDDHYFVKPYQTRVTYTIKANLTDAVDGYFGRIITKKPGQRRYRRHLG